MGETIAALITGGGLAGALGSGAAGGAAAGGAAGGAAGAGAAAGGAAGAAGAGAAGASTAAAGTGVTAGTTAGTTTGTTVGTTVGTTTPALGAPGVTSGLPSVGGSSFIAPGTSVVPSSASAPGGLLSSQLAKDLLISGLVGGVTSGVPLALAPEPPDIAVPNQAPVRTGRARRRAPRGIASNILSGGKTSPSAPVGKTTLGGAS